MLPGSPLSRFTAYVEVVLVSLVWFAFVGFVLIKGLSYLGTKPMQDWVTKGLGWPIVITFLGVFLLPYLVIAATVWKVNLSILGAKAEKVPTARAVEPPIEVV